MQTVKLIGCNLLSVASHGHACGFYPSVGSTHAAQSLRWKRKPMWLPTAKSKMFRVPKRPQLPQDEFAEIQRLYNNYRTYLRSTIAYIRAAHEVKQVQLDPAVLKGIEAVDFEKCSKINDEWNKELAAQREVRLAEEREQKRLHILKSVERNKQEQRIKLEQAEAKVRELKVFAATLITRENIDQAIEEALATTVDYNKAIDLEGNWYTEPTGIPPVKTANATVVKQ